MTEINYHPLDLSGSSYRKHKRIYSRGDIYRLFDISIDCHFNFRWSPPSCPNIILFVYPVSLPLINLVINGEIDYHSFHSLN